MRIYIITLLMFFCYSNLLCSQTTLHTIDSLKTAIAKTPADSNKVKLLVSLSFEYAYEQPDEGLKYGNEALALAKRINWKTGIGRANSVIGSNYVNKADYVNGLKYELEALKIFEQENDLPNQASLLRNIGIIHHRTKDSAAALKYYKRSMEIYNKINDESGKASVYSTMANVYYSLDSMDLVLESDLKALNIYREIKDAKGEARLLGNIANYYALNGGLAKSMPYYFDALRKERSMNNQDGIVRNMGNIGETYFDIARDATVNNKPDSLIPSGREANLDKALFYLSGAVDGALKLQQFDYYLEYQSVLSDVYLEMEKSDIALAAYKDYIIVRDSIYNLENSKKLLQTEMQYDFDKKAAATAAEQEKKDIQQVNLRRSLIGGSVFLLLIIIILANRYRIKQRSNKALATAYKNLKDTQDQLVQSEKMAAIGIMATRMSHEIYNPLNFINNFSSLSIDIIEELKTSNSEEEKNETAKILVNNMDTILRHGRRAASIIDEIQKHSEKGTAYQFFEMNDEK
ncbi:MAG: tetratricopeptide repeat protein [Chitinophagales bacterium]